ncbi:sensor histidine kinase [Terribacillus saccharophilus]|uniref:cache domain-containing sensor histidine kinase n=1 Tax=Terribacillus saccharophilus TaxID=361277 RepID=UPI000BA4EB9D|nr:sensor histidine kinase [Terribacillus saccharophilus]PAF34419.1 sensor histidine kinase [Terribacillus saccharophilus]
MRKLKSLFSNLKMKYKLFCLLFLILVSFSIGGLVLLQYALVAYNDEIHRQSAQSLKVSSALIENEIEKMKGFSYRLSTDPYLQSYLYNLKETDDDYEAYLIGVTIKKRLVDLGAFEDSIDSIQLYDTTDRGYSAGNRVISIGNERLLQYKQGTNKKDGGAEWFAPDKQDKSFVVAREVNAYPDLSFERLGMIVVRFDMHDIVSSFENSLDEKEMQLLISDSNGEIIFPHETTKKDSFLMASVQGNDGYQLVNYDADRYFVTYSSAAYTNWTYMITSPYSQLFQAVNLVKSTVLTIYLLIFVILLFFGIRFIKGITNPIEALNRKMKRVQKGEVEDFKVESHVVFSKDEAGQMHENFNKMMKQIHSLIEENYKKQLVIKDAEFKTLQAQINPHFLYNTLESINWSAKLGKHKETSRMATSLGFILRSSLETKEALIPLADELEIVNHYITIQSYRFQERLSFHADIPDYLLSCKVPKFSLQPLIENAIRYGLQEIIGVCTIRIEAVQEGGNTFISVTDDGPGMEKELINKLASGNYRPKGTGLGIRNIDNRLRLLFGPAYGLHVMSEPNVGTKIMLTIPYEGGSDSVQSSAGR